MRKYSGTNWLRVMAAVAALLVPAMARGQARTDRIRSTDNGDMTINIPVTSGAGTHDFALQIDGTNWLSATATGNGAGGIGAITTTLAGSLTWPTTVSLPATGTVITGTAAEPLNLTRTATDATAENGMTLNFTALDTTSGTTAQYMLYLDNKASTEGPDGAIVFQNSDADDAVATGILFLNPSRFTSHMNTTGAFVMGTSTVTSWTFATDGTGTAEFALPNGAIGGLEIDDDAVDGVDLADTVTLDATLLGLANGSTGAVTLNLHDYADSTDDDMPHAVIEANLTDTGTGAEDCDLAIKVTEGGAAAETRISIDADGGIIVGSVNNNTINLTTDGTGTGEVVLPDEAIGANEIVTDSIDGTSLADIITQDATTLGLANGSTGSVDLNFHDYADAADDDMAHATVSVNLTDATTGAEDADFSIGVTEAGAAVETRFTIDGDGGITVGSVNNNSFTVTTDSTGDAELVVPNESIGTAELAADAIAASKMPNTLCLAPFSTFINPTEASATDDWASLNSESNLIAGIANNSDTTEANVNQWKAPTTGFISNLYVDVDVAPGVGNDPWTITLREAGGDETLTCTIDEASTSCTAVGPSGQIAAGAILNWKISSAGGDADPTAAAVMTISACWSQ